MAETVSPATAANAERGFAPNGFPAHDFEDALMVPQAISARGGGVADAHQLAAWLQYTSSASGTFASKLASARYFGLITPAKAGKIYLTDRARHIVAPVMPEDAMKAKIDAFLEVPLFKRAFQRLQGAQLPQDPGLRNLFSHEFDVPAAKAGVAVRLFKDSARQAGFFDSAPDRLIRPSVVPSASAPAVAAPVEATVTPAPAVAEIPAAERRRGGGGGGDGSTVHPAIVGLLRVLSEKGPIWSELEQKQFTDTFTGLVKLIYPPKNEADGA